jgi:hypothetical protein
MSGQPGPIEITCDAPPYRIVRACGLVGFRSPLDVRWCRMSGFRRDQADPKGTTSDFPWMAALGLVGLREPTCACGDELPALTRFEFRRHGQTVGAFLLGQCPGCGTMFWEEWTPDRAGER